MYLYRVTTLLSCEHPVKLLDLVEELHALGEPLGVEAAYWSPIEEGGPELVDVTEKGARTD